ncbi:ATP-dependent endonuclease [Noviherbaspirillum sp. UKPF54]|uniref:ATP-dependent nuclease n=1 Tax=Noviherbaspirillum sp. UKPF54 TaxID=2601898 RepID=UPI0011B18CF5|nr:AAA family ATPase [Noviherbaspirillum sp. UKPF54]QDZ29574.1 DUF2813 domain-containing protein [Noviherbaspirillum sp. UKPF54]
MYISRVQIKNFRNFASLDVPLSQNIVMLGANRAGKSNFIYALRLVLDIVLPDSARQLKLSDIWDGADLATSPGVEIHLDFVEFDADPARTTLLTDYRLASDYRTARLSYVFRKKSEVSGPPQSEADYDFKLFGGGDETRSFRTDLRRRICLDLLHALRDAENDLASWRVSPLRPLLENAVAQVPRADLDALTADIANATDRLSNLPAISALETSLRNDIAELAGPIHDVRPKLGFAAMESMRLFRSIGFFIDDGKRGIADASLGAANVTLLALKLAEFGWRQQKNERNYTVLCVEEPEAHLHPQLQRKVFQKIFTEKTSESHALLLTTHSPNIAGIAPLNSIVLLKPTPDRGTEAFSLAGLALTAEEFEDLQRYLNATRAEILFSNGILFVEGDAEEALMPGFAASCGHNLDELGITVCNVAGVNFRPYVKLAAALAIPYAVITDWDPIDPNAPLGRKRILDLFDATQEIRNNPVLDATTKGALVANDELLRTEMGKAGLFVNTSTLEVEIAQTPALVNSLLAVLEEEGFGAKRKRRLAAWKADPKTVDSEQLLSMIADVGKGRLAGRLARKTAGLPPPPYIRAAIDFLIA